MNPQQPKCENSFYGKLSVTLRKRSNKKSEADENLRTMLIQRHPASHVGRQIQVFAFVNGWLGFIETALAHDVQRETALLHARGAFADGRARRICGRTVLGKVEAKNSETFSPNPLAILSIVSRPGFVLIPSS